MSVDDLERLFNIAMSVVLAAVRVLRNQEIRRAGGNLGDGGERNRTVWIVRRHDDIARFGHCRDLADFKDATGVAEIGLDNINQSVTQQRPELPTRIVALAGGEGERRRVAKFS